MTQPKVTICMPVYNGGHYFREALQSALAQDYANLEIVVVNDGSTDGGETERIALAAGDRITYVHQRNRGVAGALNTALSHMTGDYFAWLSHDDLHLPHKTTAQIEFLRRIGRPDACLFSDFDLIGSNDEPITTIALPARHIRENPRLPLYNGMINGCTLLIPAGVIRAFGEFDEALRATQDYDFWNRMLAKHEFFHQPEVLIRYRIHPGQGSHTPVAVTEGNVLWKAMLASRTEVERAQMFGSTRQYYSKLGKFLDATPYAEAAADTNARVATAGNDALVSVVLPCGDHPEQALRAAQSVLAQTHHPLELILVEQGARADLTRLEALAAGDARVRLLRGWHDGPASARNRALLAAQGNYIAFLAETDRFVPHKIERQLDRMQNEGALFCHASAYVSCSAHPGLGVSHSGRFQGNCYPDAIGHCPIAASTVMLHRSVVDAGFVFPSVAAHWDDELAWIDLALRYTLLGIDEPLSVLQWASPNGPLHAASETRRLAGLLDTLFAHPRHRAYDDELETLRRGLRNLAKGWKAADREIDAVTTTNGPFEPAEFSHPGFPDTSAGPGAGRSVPLRTRTQ